MGIDRRRFLAVTLAGTVMAGCSKRTGPAPPGTVFPDFQLTDIEGQLHTRADYAANPLLVNFWATWCAPCRTEMPDLEITRQRYAAHGLRVLAFSVDDDVHPVREFQLKMKLGFPLIVDTGRTLSQSLNVRTFPTTFLVARNGLIGETLLGPRPWPDYSGIPALL